MDDINSIYTDVIMEHSTATYNKHELENKTDSEHGHNPSCGDDITLEVKMNGNIIENLAFVGSGCAISQASTSIMIDLLKGKNKEEAFAMNKHYNALAFNFGPDEPNYYVIDEKLFLQLVKYLKEDN